MEGKMKAGKSFFVIDNKRGSVDKWLKASREHRLLYSLIYTTIIAAIALSIMRYIPYFMDDGWEMAFISASMAYLLNTWLFYKLLNRIYGSEAKKESPSGG